jgi:hypothetical protein
MSKFTEHVKHLRTTEPKSLKYVTIPTTKLDAATLKNVRAAEKTCGKLERIVFDCWDRDAAFFFGKPKSGWFLPARLLTSAKTVKALIDSHK